MPSTIPRKTKPKAGSTAKLKAQPMTAQQRMRARRERLKAQGLRPVQFWVPDMRDPKVQEELRQEGRTLASHPEDAEINAWIEANYDWDGWVYDWDSAT